jgi:uncharacterized membrane protein
LAVSSSIFSGSISRTVSASTSRRPSVDMLRGLVMIVMALDHVRDYFTNLKFPPEDLSRTWGALFFTRFITHYCAPTFFLLAGTGAFLSVAQGKSIPQVSRFLWTRGLWLVFLELSIVGFGWTFVFPFGFAGVLWALGWSMVALALLVRLPPGWILPLSALMMAGHNLLDGVDPDALGKFSGVWMILHRQGIYWISEPKIGFFILHPLIPWIGVMGLGYGLGAVLLRADRARLLFLVGAAMTCAFLLLRGFNLYGNGVAGMAMSTGHWTSQPTLGLTAASFLNTQKYPPSLDYLLMTLGPALMALAGFEKLGSGGRLARVLTVYGRVPMFYYVLHIYLVHLLSIVVALLFHQPAGWLWHGAVFLSSAPPNYGHHLPFIYAVWITIVALLYFPCKWFMNFKSEHKQWKWLGYV